MLTASSVPSRGVCGLALIILLVAFPLAAKVEAEQLPVLMASNWADLTCSAWNENTSLTSGLATWIENDGDRGFKILRLYRTDCVDSPWVELKIAGEEGEARCAYGGALSSHELVKDVDYVMHATTKRWTEMGRGKYGPMRAMMFGRLKFDGPMWEAMKSMGPFGSFLELVGAVESDAKACPVEEMADDAAATSAGADEP